MKSIKKEVTPKPEKAKQPPMNVGMFLEDLKIQKDIDQMLAAFDKFEGNDNT